MQFQTITSFSDIDAQEWDRLLTASTIASPFLLYGYQSAWWSFLGGGEWENAALNIVAAREDGELVGIAPLFTTNDNEGEEVHFVGSLEISDYLDFIVSADRADAFIRGVLDHIHTGSGHAPKFVLCNIADNSPTIAVLNELSRENSWDILVENAYHTPAIELADTWEDYLSGIDKKQRHEIRRKIRRAEGAEEDNVSWYFVDPQAGLDKAIPEFTRLMAFDPDKEAFLTEKMRGQMDAIMRWAADEGILQLSFLTINGENVAGYLCFDHAGQIWVYNSGFNPNSQYYSPGWVLLSYLIQDAIEKHRTHFDFMRGDEKYKYRFGAQDSFVMKAFIQRREN